MLRIQAKTENTLYGRVLIQAGLPEYSLLNQ